MFLFLAKSDIMCVRFLRIKSCNSTSGTCQHFLINSATKPVFSMKCVCKIFENDYIVIHELKVSLNIAAQKYRSLKCSDKDLTIAIVGF